MQKQTANAVINFFENRTERVEIEQQTEAEYISPIQFYELKAELRSQDLKIKVQDKFIKEFDEDIALKDRSLETVIQERNDERDSNTELRILNDTLKNELNSALRKLEESAGRFNELQNKSFVLETEKGRLIEATRVSELKIETLSKGYKELRNSLKEMQNAKVRVEVQLVKLFKKLGLSNKRKKPTEIVDKNRPRSGTRKRIDEVEIKRNRSREEMSAYEEFEDFIDFSNKKQVAKRQVKRPKQLLIANDTEQSEDMDLESMGSFSMPSNLDSQEITPRSQNPVQIATSSRKKDQIKPELHVQQGPRFKQQLSKESSLTPRSTYSNSSSVQGEPKYVRKASGITSPTKHKTPPPTLHKNSVIIENPSKRDVKLRKQSNIVEDNPWVPDIGPVEENVYEENEVQPRAFTARSMESITTNSSEEGMIERTAINEQGDVISLLDKKLDTRHLSLMNVRACSKSVQFDYEDPDMEYASDGTAITKDGKPRFYLPFNPNVVFGLKGDTFYHSLFQVFQATSKVPDGNAVYAPPYKLEEETKEQPQPPRKHPSIKRSPKKVPHSDACGASCKHLTKNVKPKVRDDMVLVLKKQELVI